VVDEIDLKVPGRSLIPGDVAYGHLGLDLGHRGGGGALSQTGLVLAYACQDAADGADADRFELLACLRVAVRQPQRAEMVDKTKQHRLQPFAAGMIERLIHQAHQLLYLGAVGPRALSLPRMATGRRPIHQACQGLDMHPGHSDHLCQQGALGTAIGQPVTLVLHLQVDVPFFDRHLLLGRHGSSVTFSNE